ncbi:MAG: hypothetical protein HY364_04405 [Candidatus Aenigmarchaeota archaeon]|nr:hypothetical protein [Candidatus Aenigmarchaeota archaeon]
MKGITPVIAVILLLLISIAVIAFATGFFQTIVTTTGEQAVTGSEKTGSRVLQVIEFVVASKDAINVKNSGAENILKDDITFLVGGAPVDACGGTTSDNILIAGSATPTEAASGELVTCSLTGVCDGANLGKSITITAPGNSITGKTCPAE